MKYSKYELTQFPSIEAVFSKRDFNNQNNLKPNIIVKEIEKEAPVFVDK